MSGQRTDILASLELGVLLAGQNLEGVGTEVVALRLEQVRGQDLAAVPVEERERGAERGSGDTPEHGLRDDAPPAGLRLLDRVVEELVEEEGLEVTLLDEGLRDVAEEDGLQKA